MLDFRCVLILFMLSGCASSHQTTALDYERGEWPHWLDEDRDCQNTRAEILIERSIEPTEGECLIKKGNWYCEYTAKVFYDASKLDIDHIVPLKHAYDHGADKWSRDKRAMFANDPFNLIAVDRGANRSKGAKGPHEWMPPNEKYGCTYVQRWMSVKALYGLDFSKQERRFLRRYIKRCE